VFWQCKQVAASGDVAIQKQGFSIVDTREPVAATPLSLFSFLRVQVVEKDSDPRRNQILIVGCHRVVRRLVSPGLQPYNASSQQLLQNVA
jgi:hypothetical protein